MVIVVVTAGNLSRFRNPPLNSLKRIDQESTNKINSRISWYSSIDEMNGLIISTRNFPVGSGILGWDTAKLTSLSSERKSDGDDNGMATTVLQETKSLSAVEKQPPPAAAVTKHNGSHSVEVEVVPVKCFCCGLMEECTPPYIARVRERYQGRWICGLCAEAVKDEALRPQRNISTAEALKRHIKFCQQFRSSSPPNNPTEDLILAMKQLLFRTLDSPRKDKRMTCRPLGRSQSCFSDMSGPHKEAAQRE
ncbi:hypothetical protein L6164_024430 [Bauhinia variegata]|uniref:Uncharacterized protein n=1 Tax=Bauhinia variegata TaxID=167791 RepID=A0ACB9LXI6_BAUVA|nr:hypothetical protein L6164_024430 [Bauhinia variegata]